MNNCFIENPRTHPVCIQTKFKKKSGKKNVAQFATAFVKKVNIGKTKKKSGFSTWYLDHVAMARIFLA